MKNLKPVIVAGTLSLASIGGVAAYQLVPRVDDGIVLASDTEQEVTEEEVMPKPEEPTTEPSPITEVTNPAPLPASQPVAPAPQSTPAPAPAGMFHEELWKKVMAVVVARTPKDSLLSQYTVSIASAITNTYESKGRAFTEAGIQGDVGKCLSYLQALPDRGSIGRALSQNDCGI